MDKFIGISSVPVPKLGGENKKIVFFIYFIMSGTDYSLIEIS